MRSWQILLAILVGILLCLGWFRNPTVSAPQSLSIEDVRSRVDFPVRLPRNLPPGAKLASIQLLTEKPRSRPPQPPREDAALPEDFTTVGIGAHIGPSAGGWRVEQLVPNGPASRSGVRVGELIQEINGRSVQDAPPEQVISLLGGEPGKRVALKLWSPSGTRIATLRTERLRVTRRPPAESVPPQEPRHTVYAHYTLGQHRFRLSATRENPGRKLVGGTIRSVKIKNGFGSLATRGARPKTSLLWSFEGTTYLLSDWDGKVGADALIAMARSM
jgi:hypothetical protein